MDYHIICSKKKEKKKRKNLVVKAIVPLAALYMALNFDDTKQMKKT
jgi:hypothetical protein